VRPLEAEGSIIRYSGRSLYFVSCKQRKQNGAYQNVSAPDYKKRVGTTRSSRALHADLLLENVVMRRDLRAAGIPAEALIIGIRFGD
jgi:hypothetical protein